MGKIKDNGQTGNNGKQGQPAESPDNGSLNNGLWRWDLPGRCPGGPVVAP